MSAQVFPASLAQRRMWLHCQGPHGAAGYTLATARRVSGPLELGALRASIEYIAGRHEMLRTTFEERDGDLVQVVHPPGPICLSFADLSATPDPPAQALAVLRAAAREPFDLSRAPLVRFALVRLGEAAHELHQVSHHIISDAEAWVLFIEELAAVYPALRRGESPPLPPAVSLQPRHIAVREHDEMHPGAENFERSLAWWRGLAGAPDSSPPLPFTRSTPGEGSASAQSEGILVWGLDASVVDGLERVDHRFGASFFSVTLAAYAALLAAESGRGEALIGTMVGHRTPELQALFGCFTHLVLLRLPFDPQEPFAQSVANTAAAVRAAKDHSQLSYEDAAESLAREGLILPAVRAGFLVRRRHSIRFDDIEIGASVLSADHYTVSGFQIMLDRALGTDHCFTPFDPRIYDPAAVHAFTQRYRALLAAIAGDADRSIGALLRAS